MTTLTFDLTEHQMTDKMNDKIIEIDEIPALIFVFYCKKNTYDGLHKSKLRSRTFWIRY